MSFYAGTAGNYLHDLLTLLYYLLCSPARDTLKSINSPCHGSHTLSTHSLELVGLRMNILLVHAVPMIPESNKSKQSSML